MFLYQPEACSRLHTVSTGCVYRSGGLPFTNRNISYSLSSHGYTGVWLKPSLLSDINTLSLQDMVCGQTKILISRHMSGPCGADMAHSGQGDKLSAPATSAVLHGLQ